MRVAAVEVDGRTYAVRLLELSTPRGHRRYSAEIMLSADDRIILDDDSLLSLEARALRLVPATIHSRTLARATAA
jgi:hypothetical protein